MIYKLVFVVLLSSVSLACHDVNDKPSLAVLIAGEETTDSCKDAMEKILWEIDPYVQDLWLETPSRTLIPSKQHAEEYWTARDRAVEQWQRIKDRCFEHQAKETTP